MDDRELDRRLSNIESAISMLIDTLSTSSSSTQEKANTENTILREENDGEVEDDDENSSSSSPDFTPFTVRSKRD